MSLLLNSLVVSDPTSKYHNLLINILISSDGIIKKISKNKINDKVRNVVDCKSSKISKGWIDFNANFCDPGYEFKEDLNSGSNLASKSGFTEVVLSPDTNPVIQTKNDISYIINNSSNELCNLYPCASVTKNAEGKEMNDLMDLNNEGAIAFSDPKIEDTELILNTLLYLKQFDGLYISKPKEKYLSKGLINDSLNSNILGIKALPHISETIAIKRDLSLLEYTNGRIHFSGISCKESVNLIRDAKKRGLSVTCDVPIYNFLLDDSKILNFDTNYKVFPPLRANEDIKELIRGLKDDTIDVITSNHQPQDFDSKNCEFEKASFGIISLQTFYSNMLELSGKISLDKILEKVSINPRKILGLSCPEIEIGERALFTIFDENGSWDFNEKTNLSKSSNSPWMNWSLRGKVNGVVVGCKTNLK